MPLAAFIVYLMLLIVFTVAHNFACSTDQETRGPHLRWLRVGEWMYGR